MNNIKMSDAFDLPVESCVSFSDCTAMTVTYESLTDEQIEAVDHAINNHDKLVSDRDELIHALESALADWQVDVSFLAQVADYDAGDSGYLKQSKACNDLINKIKGGE